MCFMNIAWSPVLIRLQFAMKCELSCCSSWQWFWEVVEDMTQEERVLLLQFVTGR